MHLNQKLNLSLHKSRKQTVCQKERFYRNERTRDWAVWKRASSFLYPCLLHRTINKAETEHCTLEIHMHWSFLNWYIYLKNRGITIYRNILNSLAWKQLFWKVRKEIALLSFINFFCNVKYKQICSTIQMKRYISTFFSFRKVAIAFEYLISKHIFLKLVCSSQDGYIFQKSCKRSIKHHPCLKIKK